MMRTSNFFLLREDTANKKPDQECKAPPMVAKLLTGLFLSVVGNQEEERDKIWFVVNQAKATQVSQFDLVLEKNGSNWKIIE